MLIVLSPAKNLDFETPLPTKRATKAPLLDEAQPLAKALKKLAPHQLSSLMKISDKLGQLNYDRNQAWQLPFSKSNARPAVFAFKGDVYLGLDAYSLSEEEISFAQDHLRILSGLYGVLRPLDLMQAYRLEMGTKLKSAKGKDLYEYWGDTITENLNKQIKKLKSPVLINLASNEYFSSVNQSLLAAEVITPVFKEWKSGQYKIISFFAKKARGLMSAYIIKNKIQKVEKIKDFDYEGYRFEPSMSDGSKWVFTRKQS